MKYNDWLNLIKGEEKHLICPDCGYDLGPERNFSFKRISPPGVVCPKCDEIVLWVDAGEFLINK